MTLATLQKPCSITVESSRLKTDWQDWESSLLVNSGLGHKAVNVYFPDSGQRAQSFIYAFDLSRSELLLDYLYPYPNQLKKTFAMGIPVEFWIQLKASEAFYNMLVVLTEQSGQFITVQVLEAGLTRNRRWEDRIYFPSRSAPKVEVMLPNSPVQQAQLSNLSIGGAQLLVFGTATKLQLKHLRTLSCRIKFSNEFTIDVKAEVRQCQFSRSPCCHSIIRLAFTPCPTLRSQLASLIAAFHPRSP